MASCRCLKEIERGAREPSLATKGLGDSVLTLASSACRALAAALSLTFFSRSARKDQSALATPKRRAR